MTLSSRLSELIHACFTGIWIESHEHEDALAEITTLCRAESWRFACWDIEQGLTVVGQEPVADISPSDPLAAIRSLAAFSGSEEPALLVLVNFHRFLQSAEVVQALAKQIAVGKQNRTFVVILSPVVQVPTELDKQIIVVEHPLPGREQLQDIASGIATMPEEMPQRTELERLLDAAAGLTRYEAESRDAVGTEIPNAKKERPDVAAPRRRQIRRPRWSGCRESVLQARPAPDCGQLSACAASWHPAVVAAWLRQVALLQGPGERSRPADDHTRHRQLARIARRPVRGQHPPGTTHHRRHGAGGRVSG
jgi:hypothetical protein